MPELTRRDSLREAANLSGLFLPLRADFLVILQPKKEHYENGI